MAIIYYPKSQYMFQKSTVSASYESLVLAVNPNTILYFDTASGLNAISASDIPVTASWAISASYVGGTLAATRGKTVVLCSGFTPSAEGPDVSEIMMPYRADGGTAVTWSIRRFNFRVGTSGSLSSSVTFEKSQTTGAFSASALMTLMMPSYSYETYSYSSATINSGDKMRFNVNYIGNSEAWMLTAELDG